MREYTRYLYTYAPDFCTYLSQFTTNIERQPIKQKKPLNSKYLIFRIIRRVYSSGQNNNNLHVITKISEKWVELLALEKIILKTMTEPNKGKRNQWQWCARHEEGAVVCMSLGGSDKH